MLAVALPESLLDGRLLVLPAPHSFASIAKRENESKQYSIDSHLDSDIAGVVFSIEQLLIKYKMYNKSNETPAVSGGLQQFIINKLKKRGQNEKSVTNRLKALYMREESVHFMADGDDLSVFDCLPVDLKLYIFSFLDTRSLCRACSVSREWNQLLWDDLLWRQRLETDKLSWSQVSHTSNPHVYSEVNSDLANKEIYLRCSPEVQANQREENSTFHQVSTVLKYLMPKKSPKVAMFGPGLESSTSGLVHKILYEDESVFSRVAMFPGQFDGFGAGMTLQLPNSGTFHLTVLYTASQRERENQALHNRLSRNRMLNQQRNQAQDENAAPSYELHPALQQLCHTLNAFILVVDASGTKEAVAAGNEELRTMVHERWASPHVPVLVMSCIPSVASPRIPAVNVVDALDLSSLNRPWMVMDCVVDTLQNVDKGVRWIVDMCQRK